MAQSAQLRVQDLQAIYQLVGECRELGDDPEQWRTHLLAEVARLTGAAVATEYEGVWEPVFVVDGTADWGWDNGFDRKYWEGMNTEFAQQGIEFNPIYRPYVVALERGIGPALTRADVVPDPVWYRSAYYQEYHRPSGADAMMYSFAKLLDGDRLSALVLVRPYGQPDFPQRARAVVGELHALIASLVGGPLAQFGEPSPMALPPRTREVLKCLLEGDSDKQIKIRLKMSLFTVNDHVKRIYAHFGASSRPELLARWIRRGWHNGFRWAERS